MSTFITDYHISTTEKVNDLSEVCSCCGAKSYPIHTPMAWKNGLHCYPKFCDLCFEEFEAGMNPVFKRNKAESFCANSDVSERGIKVHCNPSQILSNK